MSEATRFLIQHGYVLIFAVVLADQIGIPFPAVPWLLAAGVLARTGQVSLGAMVGLAIVASLLAHTVWYEAGRRRGARALRLVCRLSLEPDSCVRRTEDLFQRQGPKALVLAYFVPTFGIVAQPIAGMLGMSLPRFLAWNVAGAGLWSGLFLGLGYGLGRQLETVAQAASQLGGLLLVLLVAAFAAYLGWKVFERHRVVRQLRVARISPEELKQRLDANEPIFILDLRHAMEFQADPRTIPGALRIPAEDLDTRLGEIPRDREIVLYCS